MPKTIEDVKNELTGLQYSVDQIQLSKINIDLMVVSNTSFTEELIENSERYFESRTKRQKEWERKVTEAAGLEYDESKPFEREKILEILGDEMDEFPGPDNNEMNNGHSEEIESFLRHIKEVKQLDENINNQLDDYLALFSPNQQSDFHFMLDALQNFVEWSEDYSQKIRSIQPGKASEKQLHEFGTSSEFVSLCCNWLSSTVSTVLKYGFGGSESDRV